MGGQRFTGSSDMCGQVTFSVSDLREFDRIDDQAMLRAYKVPSLVINNVYERPAVVLGGVPVALDRCGQLRDRAARVGGEMQCTVKAQEDINVPGLLNPVLDLFQTSQVSSCQIRDTLRQGQGFDTLSHLVDALTIGHVELRDRRPTVGPQYDQALCFEHSKRFADR